MANPDSVNGLRRVTLYDVAERAGVSHQTVSRVINNHPHVAHSTRNRVLNVIAELGYRPDITARSLVTRRSQTIALITPGIGYYSLSRTILKAEQATQALGYHVRLTNLPDVKPETLRDAIEQLDGWLVDGIILITSSRLFGQIDVASLLQGIRIPVVQVLGVPTVTIPSIATDQFAGGQLIAQYMVDMGHRRICEISGPLAWYDARARHEAWLTTLHSAGITPGKSIEGNWSISSGYQAVLRLLDEGESFTGLVVGNDPMALGAMRGLRDRGLRIPEDVSIVGYDDVPEAAYLEPPLTTVRQDFDTMGRQAVEYLATLISQPDTRIGQQILQPVLIERQSVRRA
jgi:DNA-binding LacI/PurR family transcriptional regulator